MNDRQVTIEISGRLAHTEPTALNALEPLTDYTVNGFERSGPCGYRAITVKHSLAEIDEHGWYILPVHLVQRAVQLLKEAQYTPRVVSIKDEGPGTVVCEEELVRSAADEQALLKKLMTSPTGLIKIGSEARLLDMIKMLCRAFHQARIHVVVPTRERIRQLNLELEERLGMSVGIAGSRRTGEDLRVVVGTLQGATRDIHQRHGDDGVDDGGDGQRHEEQRGRYLLLVVDAASVATDRQAPLLLRNSAPRAYGFLRPGQRLDSHQRTLLAYLVGGTLWSEPGLVGARAAVRVPLLQPPLGHLTTVRRQDTLDWKRKTIWNNSRRNDFITGVAAALAGQNQERLAEYGLFLDGDALARHPSITILVESAKHGRDLHQRLAGWEFWHNVPDVNPGRPIELFKAKLFDRVIMTLLSASSQSDIATDILIRAGGTEWPLNSVGFPPTAGESASDVMLFDLADDTGKLARAATRSRLRHYRRSGWQIGKLPAWLQATTEQALRR